ncbi:MAG: hypothetical protein K8T91_04045 [Planctomycetes bacterium]|nr:hypothetical protein [Planctomycetota bacterium]
MQGYFSRAGLSLAIVGLLMVGSAQAQIGIRAGIKPAVTVAPAVTTAAATTTTAAATTAATSRTSETSSSSSCNACCEWDCAKIKCTVEKIQCKTNALLQAERCSRVRNRCLFEQVVALNTELCKLSKCECLSSCEVERIISCIESKVCELEKLVKCSGNRTWICLVSEIKCLVGELRQCKKSCNTEAPV